MLEGWAQIGVGVEYLPLDESAFVQTVVQARDFDVFLGSYTWSFAGNQDELFACDAYANYTKYCNPEYDALVAQARQAGDPGLRREWLMQASNIVNEDVPIAMLW